MEAVCGASAGLGEADTIGFQEVADHPAAGHAPAHRPDRLGLPAQRPANTSSPYFANSWNVPLTGAHCHVVRLPPS